MNRIFDYMLSGDWFCVVLSIGNIWLIVMGIIRPLRTQTPVTKKLSVLLLLFFFAMIAMMIDGFNDPWVTHAAQLRFPQHHGWGNAALGLTGTLMLLVAFYRYWRSPKLK